MKNFLDSFLDFVTGGFFNVIGAAARKLFSKRKYSDLVEESLSNYIGMVVFTIILLGGYFYLKMKFI